MEDAVSGDAAGHKGGFGLVLGNANVFPKIGFLSVLRALHG